MTVCRMIQPETLEEALEALAGERAMACAGATICTWTADTANIWILIM